MTEQYTPTTSEMSWAWAEWRRPFLERDNWFPTAASLREVSDAEFQRWLAERDAEVAAKAWDEGANALSVEMVPDSPTARVEGMKVRITRPTNPYREEVQS